MKYSTFRYFQHIDYVNISITIYLVLFFLDLSNYMRNKDEVNISDSYSRLRTFDSASEQDLC